jgi:hypothetical protein
MTAFSLSAFLTVGASLTASAMYNDISLPLISRMSESRRSFWVSILDRLILGLSDQQLVTGISILTVGFIKLPYHISTYHFSLITSLAMFSCSAHLASVLSLRRYFQENPEVAKIRIGFMLLFAALLSIALILIGPVVYHIGNNVQNRPISCPAIWMIHHDYQGERIVGCFFSFYLAICYWAALSYVFPNGEIFFTKWLLTKPLETIEAVFRIHQFHERFMHWRPQFLPLSISHFLQSVWWIASFVVSLLIRKLSTSESEAVWSFGQILAVLLIAIPFLNAVEVYHGMWTSYLSDTKSLRLTYM